MTEQTALEKIDSTLKVVGRDIGRLKRNQNQTSVIRRHYPFQKASAPIIFTPPKKNITVINKTNFKQSIGMCEKTGKAITGAEHLQQSFRNIILTEKFQRVMLRSYGSDFYERIDHPTNENLLLKAYAEITALIEKWEPRFDLKQILIKAGERSGQFFYTFKGDFLGKLIEVGVNT
jgi:phage baseplate assembly protein W